MNQIKSGIQYAFQTQNRVTLAVSGPGHAAMECAIFNSLEPGESVLIAVNGIWGERAAEIAERIGTVSAFSRKPGTESYKGDSEHHQFIYQTLFNRCQGEHSCNLCWWVLYK